MDDYTRDLEEEMARYALPNPYHHKRTWRLLFVSSDGRVVQSGNYRQVVTATLITLCLLSTALAATTVLWLHTKKRLADAIVQQRRLSVTLEEQTADQELLMARLALAEEKVPDAPPKVEDAISAPEEPEAPPAVSTPFVRVDKVEASRSGDEKTLKVTFRLHNDTPDNRLVKGRLFLVFPPKEGNKDALRSLPPVLLQDGIPADPTQGESFQMRNYITMTFRLLTDAGPLPHAKVKIYAFDENGTLRYKKTFSF